MGAFGPQGSDDGTGQLQIGDEENARIDGTAPDSVAVRTTLLVVFPRNVDAEVDAAVIDQIERADQFGDSRDGAGLLPGLRFFTGTQIRSGELGGPSCATSQPTLSYSAGMSMEAM